MKTQKLTGLLMVLFFSLTVTAQELALLNVTNSETKEKVVVERTYSPAHLVYEVDWLKTNEVQFVDQTYIERHFLGEQMAKKRYLLDQTFTRRVPIAPGNPATKTEITKPYLYNAANDIERYLRRSIRRGNISEDVAKIKMNIVLDVIINTYYIETTELEETIRKTSKPEDLLSVFIDDVKVVLN